MSNKHQKAGKEGDTGKGSTKIKRADLVKNKKTVRKDGDSINVYPADMGFHGKDKEENLNPEV